MPHQETRRENLLEYLKAVKSGNTNHLDPATATYLERKGYLTVTRTDRGEYDGRGVIDFSAEITPAGEDAIGRMERGEEESLYTQEVFVIKPEEDFGKALDELFSRLPP